MILSSTAISFSASDSASDAATDTTLCVLIRLPLLATTLPFPPLPFPGPSCPNLSHSAKNAHAGFRRLCSSNGSSFGSHPLKLVSQYRHVTPSSSPGPGSRIHPASTIRPTLHLHPRFPSCGHPSPTSNVFVRAATRTSDMGSSGASNSSPVSRLVGRKTDRHIAQAQAGA